jgi:hypothetical protein
MLLKAMFDLETTNEAIKSGGIKKTLDAVAQEIKPEAAFFLAEEGERTAYFFFEMKESSQIPPVTELLFMELGARVTLTPVMNREELARGLDAWAKKSTSSR